MKDRSVVRDELEKLAEGIGKHDSLANAALYAVMREDGGTASFMTEKVEERSALIRELMKLNAESGFMLLPQLPHDDLGAFMAIEKLAASNPGAHEFLGRIAEIDKMRFMVGTQSAAH